MGYRSDGYALLAQLYVASPEREGEWLEGDLVARAILPPVRELLTHLRWVQRDEDEPVQIDSPAALDALSATWGNDDIVKLSTDPSSADPESHAILTLDPLGPRLFFGIGGAALTALRPRLLDLAADWARAWSRSLAPTLRFAYGSFAPSGDDFPRTVPPRQSSLCKIGSLVQLAGQAWHATRPDRNALLDGLLHAPLPAGASRSVDGDVVAIRFVDRLDDAGAIRRARAAHEAWVTPLASAEPERGWNEQGDRIVVPPQGAAPEPLTLYDAERAIGYKAMVVFPNGSVDEPLWQQMMRLARAGALPGGAHLASLRLVVPRRADALKIHDRALADGFELVAYPEGKVFWQVRPLVGGTPGQG